MYRPTTTADPPIPPKGGSSADRESGTMKLITYYAEATGVIWFAVRNKTHVTPWCINPLDALRCFYKKDLIKIDNEWRLEQ